MKVRRGKVRRGVGDRAAGGAGHDRVPVAASSAVDAFRRRARHLAGRGIRALRARAPWLIPRSTGASRWLPPGLTLDDFFDTLRRQHVTYVVLRWFEELPRVEPGHDIDILVADEHVGFVQTLLADRPHRRSQHLDVYSVSGLPGSDLEGLPCVPPPLAREMVTRAVWIRGTYRVPDLEPHLLGLAYHVAYHKGYSSGLCAGSGTDEIRQQASHDYGAVLVDLAGRLGESVTPTLDGVDRFLADRGLRPSREILERLAVRNLWIKDRFLRPLPDDDRGW